jgi:osmotically-inducible protein OsmY
MSTLPKRLAELITERVLERTGRRVLDLSVEVVDETVTLRGRARSFHVKQLALHGARDVLPTATLHNHIRVEAYVVA